MKIRKETAEDIEAVFKINISAFPNEEEAQLVNRLRETVSPLISLVAEGEQEIIGHILFTPVTLDSDTNLFLMGLAPMAVNPPAQNKGIGSQLVRAGLEECRALECEEFTRECRSCRYLRRPRMEPQVLVGQQS